MSKRKPYEREVKFDWWLKDIFYIKYIIREGSSVFITLYSLILVWGVFCLNQGEVAFNAWMKTLQDPLFIIFHCVSLLFAAYHSITWFSLAPKALDLWIKGKRLNDKIIINAHYIAFIAISVFCFFIV